MPAESRFSQKLQKMQIICTNQLYAEKESRKENLHGQQEERRSKIVKVGDNMECPECGRKGRVVWLSQDRKTAGIRCPASHHLTSRPKSKLGSTARPQSKTDRNIVFLMEIK